jgi:phospholipid transport system substrate-binding protein
MREERKARIIALVAQRFDFREMSQRALARYWKDRSKQEQEEFAALFKKVLENTYIGKVDEYSGEQIFFDKEEVRGNKAVVYSHFFRNNVETPVIYRLTQDSNEWMVYDVIVEGVSLVRNYRTQFESIIEKEKYPGLVAKLEEKAHQVDQSNEFGEIGVSK